jgi:hypothetical protein
MDKPSTPSRSMISSAVVSTKSRVILPPARASLLDGMVGWRSGHRNSTVSHAAGSALLPLV